MGVKGLGSWIREEFPSASKPALLRYDHVMVDVAPLLYNAIIPRRFTSEVSYFQGLFKKLDQILEFAKPQQTLMLALDGPAPLSKLLLQRRRRQMSARQERVTLGRNGGKLVSKLGLAPGTPFMARLEEALHFWACQRLGSYQHRNLSIEINGARVPGEGEVKVVQRLSSPWPGTQELGGSYLILGGDSDLKLLTLMCAPPPGARLTGADAAVVHVAAVPDRTSIKQTKAENGNGNYIGPCFDVGIMKTVLAKTISGKQSGLTDEALQTLMADFTAVLILAAGNDYLPGVNLKLMSNKLSKLPNISGLSGMWTAYRNMRKMPKFRDRTLIVRTDDGNLAWDGGALDCMLKKRGVPSFTVPQQRSAVRAAAAQNGGAEVVSGNGSSAFGPSDFDGSTSDDNEGQTAAEMPPSNAREYLQGILWVLDMYSNSRCADYRSRYSRRTPSGPQLLAAVSASQVSYIPPQPLQEEQTFTPQPQSAAFSAVAARAAAADAAAAADELRLRDAELAAAASVDTVVKCRAAPEGARRPTVAAATVAEAMDAIAAREAVEKAAAMAKAAARAAVMAAIDAEQTSCSDSAGMAPAIPPPHAAPMLPAICALAMLPGGQASIDHAVLPLRNLMLDNKSPIAELYRECPTCISLSQKARAFRRAYEEATRKVQSARAAVRETTAQEGSVASDSTAAAALEQVQSLDTAVNAARSAVSKHQLKQAAHVQKEHPYRPFPLATLEQAVAAIPQELYSDEERPLLSFGPVHRFRFGKKGQLNHRPRPPLKKFAPLPEWLPIQLDTWHSGCLPAMASAPSQRPTRFPTHSRQQMPHKNTRTGPPPHNSKLSRPKKQPSSTQPQQPSLAARASSRAIEVSAAHHHHSGSVAFSSSSRPGLTEGTTSLARTASAFFGGESLQAAARLGGRIITAQQQQPWLLRWRNVSGVSASAKLLHHRPRAPLLGGAAVLRMRFGCAAVAARGVLLAF